MNTGNMEDLGLRQFFGNILWLIISPLTILYYSTQILTQKQISIHICIAFCIDKKICTSGPKEYYF